MKELLTQKHSDRSPRSCRAGRALILLNRIQDSGSLVLDGKAFQYFLNRGWNRAEVQQAADDLAGSGAIRINPNSQSTLELEVIA